MTDEAHDQLVQFSSEELAQLDKVDLVVEKALTVGDPTVAWSHVYGLRRGGELAGRAIAKTLFEMHQRWDIFSTDDDFVDAASAGTGFSPQTIRKGMDYWEFVLRPHPELIGLPVGALHLIAPAAKSGELEAEDWEELRTAPDKEAVREIIRRKRGAKTSSGITLVVMLERDGTLKARKGSGPYVSFGYFNIEADDLIAKQAIARVCRVAGIIAR